MQRIEVVIHRFNRLAKLLKCVAKRAIIAATIKFFLVGQREIFFRKTCRLEESSLVFVAPLVENRTHYAHRVGVSIGIHINKIGAGETLLLLSPRHDIVFHERLSEVRHHRPVNMRSRNTSKLVQALQLEDNSNKLHCRVQRASRAHIALACVEAF